MNDEIKTGLDGLCLTFSVGLLLFAMYAFARTYREITSEGDETR